jgi:hypothetical protein
MDVVAAIVLVGVLGVSLWSWRQAPARKMADQFVGIWQVRPWGRQFFVDFFGLEVILALWMIADVERGGSWAAAVIYIVLMPFFGAASAALYWLVR